MYRLRTPDSHKPLFISNQITHDYSENRVDTLHLKNLLHLGEDRYLTTLVLKHFPSYKTKFVRDAHAQTIAPDAANVLLSQRRRWINSTVHNLAELVFLDQLCGFCCFSMRFVVFIDLVSTIVAPVTVAYIGYLIYLVVHEGSTIPILSIIMLAAIYGLQALVFVFRMRWDMIAWMVFYILAIPVFSFFLPLYSFWKMDDFSWGSTRLVVGEKGKKIVIHDEGKFDPRSIPLKSWNDYENELWDHESNHSQGSWMPQEKLEYGSRSPSAYGFDTRGVSPAVSYQDLRARSTYDPPQLPRHGSLMSSPMGGAAQIADNRSFYGADIRSQYAGSFYGQPMMDTRASSYSSATTVNPGMGHRTSSHNFDQRSSYVPQSRSVSAYLPDVAVDSASIGLGENGVTDTQLEASIRQICAGADLDTLTKKGVRKKLEEEYGMTLTTRKDTINRIIEKVLAGESIM